MFIVTLNYQVNIETVDRVRPKHVEFLDQFYNTGKFITSGRKYTQDGGIIIVNSDSIDEVKMIMEQDPFYTEGVAKYEFLGFNPTKYCDELKNKIS